MIIFTLLLFILFLLVVICLRLFTTSQTSHCRLNWSIVGTGTYKITIHRNKTISFKNLVILYGLLPYFGVYVSVCKRDDLQPILLTQFTFFKRHDVMRLVSVIVYSTIPIYLRKFLLCFCIIRSPINKNCIRNMPIIICIKFNFN